MQTIEFLLEGEYIELIQLLKAANVAQTGGHAKIIVDEGAVVRNGEIETRKRAKIRKGEEVMIEDELIIKVV